MSVLTPPAPPVKRKAGRPPGSKNKRPQPQSLRNKHALIAKEAERERWFQAVVGQESDLSEVQWEALKTKVLMGLVKSPAPNSAAALAAMKEMDKQRKARRLGTREAVQETKSWCENRLRELDALERWAKTQGVSATNKGGTEHPPEGKVPESAA